MHSDDKHKIDIESQFRWLMRSTPFVFLCSILIALVLASIFRYGTGSELSTPSPTLILYPVFAMFLLVALVLTRMGWKRIGAVRSEEIDINFYRAYTVGEEPESLRFITRNFSNLFEMPVLFYVGVILVYLTHQVSYWMVGLAWVYVALRYVHSYIHLTSNIVPVRLSVYAVSGLVLLVMWSTLFVQLLLAETAP